MSKTDFIFTCPDKTYVTEINGTASSTHIQSIQLKCSNQTDVSQVFGTTIPQEAPFSYRNKSGFRAIAGYKSDQQWTSLLPYNHRQQPMTNCVGGGRGSDEDNPGNLNKNKSQLRLCNPGQLMTGISGQLNENGEVKDFQITCAPAEELNLPRLPMIIQYLPWIVVIVIISIGLYMTYNRKCPVCPDQQYCRLVNAQDQPILSVSKVV
jgi:hypothetical protein